MVWMISSDEDTDTFTLVTMKNKFWARFVQFRVKFVPVAWNFKVIF